ncbi:MAG: type II and III secretion system protein [Desulfobacterales bacterium]|nr:type II and III secretion system protein [Desulfobacterales bacterium]
MKNKGNISWYVVFFIIFAGCGSHQQLAKKDVETAKQAPEARVEKAPQNPGPKPAPAPGTNITRAPAGLEHADYQIRPLDIEMKAGKPYLPVGAELISKQGKVSLKEVIKSLAVLKGFSVSWSDDVAQEQLVDVDIRPEDNYWDALNNVLRQLDYFYDVDKETIVVRYKETLQYQLVMPFLEEEFKTSVGGDLLGGGESEGKMKGEVQMSGGMKEPLDFWKEIEANVNAIIQHTATVAGPKEGKTGSGQGYLIIDRPLGIITVTAPRRTQTKIKGYLDNLENEIYKQVIIEAKIIEVRLNNKSEMGIDWDKVINATLAGTISFGKAATGRIYPFPHADGFIRQVTMGDHNFTLMLKALNEQGTSNVLANPKLTILNGHGATITVGENVTYIKSVEKTVDSETGDVSWSVDTATILSGIGLAVMANVMDNDEVILYIVPVTSELTEPIEYRTFGGAGDESEVGLPEVKLKEMATFAKVQNGQTLIIGGLMDSTRFETKKGTPILEDLPLLGRLFKMDTKQEIKRELVILLKPKIIGWGTMDGGK